MPGPGGHSMLVHNRQYEPGPSPLDERIRGQKRRRIHAALDLPSRPSVLACTELLASLSSRPLVGEDPMLERMEGGGRKRHQPLLDASSAAAHQGGGGGGSPPSGAMAAPPASASAMRGEGGGGPPSSSDHWAWLDDVLPPKHDHDNHGHQLEEEGAASECAQTPGSRQPFLAGIGGVGGGGGGYCDPVSAHGSFSSSGSASSRGGGGGGSGGVGGGGVMGLIQGSSWSSDSGSEAAAELELATAAGHKSGHGGAEVPSHTSLPPPPHHHHHQDHHSHHHHSHMNHGMAGRGHVIIVQNKTLEGGHRSPEESSTDHSGGGGGGGGDDWGWYVEDDADRPGTGR